MMVSVWAVVAAVSELLVILVSFVVGRVTARRQSRRLNYNCACTHSLAYHDDNGCHELTQAWNGVDRACECRQYVGERPPPSLDDIMRNIELES